MNEPLPSEIVEQSQTKTENLAEMTRDGPARAPAETVAYEPHAGSPERPTIPGFEVRAVLGHGGMGVVYRAWQFSLKRHVALKMILAAEHAGPQHLARFHTEAEAVARLQHPNIVQIHEVGEHQGRPYVCLEYVDGGSLAHRLNHRPQPPLECARLVERLARAMYYTHQRGIVHRDLKPANILLQRENGGSLDDELNPSTSAVTLDSSSASLSCFLPKITDFGLAKQLQEDAGQTISGAVMGTPSYMAPEQAAGKTHEIGPLSDVYALGVILYEMLTGRPPFHGDTQVETLRQVIHEEPVPPSRIQPGVPRDLETICLKAMAKEPGRRYSSALTLAQDLERFVAGEPILARREGPARRLWRKVCRRPVTFVSLLVLVLALIAGGAFAWEFSNARRVRGITAAINQGLQEHDWPRSVLEKMEALIDQLEPLSPEQAANARRNLYQRYADALIEAARREQNGPDEFARIERDRAEILQPRAGDLADTVSKAMTKHVSTALNLRLTRVELTAEYLDDVAKLLAAIQSFDGPGADRARVDLDLRLENLFQQNLGPDRTLSVDDLARLEAVVNLLTTRRPQLADRLRHNLANRQGAMQTIGALLPPFADVEKFIPANTILQTPTHLLSRGSSQADEHLVLLKDPCQGNIQMEAAFAYPSWGMVKQLGLSLNTSADLKRGYSFLLGAQQIDNGGRLDLKKKSDTLEWARAASAPIMMTIRRNGIVLRQKTVPVGVLAARPLTLRATRAGSVLTLEVFQDGALASSLRFDDIFAAGSSKSGVFALLWPGSVGLEALYLRRQTLPPVKGPLELADHHLDEGDVKTALALYQKQAENAANPEIRQEARCKQALCLLELKHVAEATLLLAPLAQEKGRWPLLATCQLWLIYLRENKRVEADQVCDSLLARGYGDAEQLASVISDDVRSAIRNFANEEFSSFSFLMDASEQRLHSMERIHKVNEMFHDSEVRRFHFRWHLLRAYRIVGMSSKAEALVKHWLQNDPPLTVGHEVQRVMYLEELGWICRELGRPQQALDLIDQQLRDKVPGTGSRLLIERARLHAALKNWQQADKDLEEYFQARTRLHDDYQSFSAACLLRGFLRRRVGDEAGARQAWTMKYTPAGSDPQLALAVSDARMATGGGIPVMQAIIMASLTDSMTDEQAKIFQDRLMKDLPANYRSAVGTLRFRLSAAVMRGMFRSQRGLESAERMAFQDIPLADYLRRAALAGTTSLIKRDGFAAAAELSAEKEELIWELSDQVWRAIRAGKLTQINMVQIGMTWKGTTNFFGWAGLAPALEMQPSLRGPLAYVMAHRLLRLGLPPGEAVPLFRTAHADAPAGSPLRRLAEAELQRLKAK